MGYVIVDLETGERFERLAGETFPLASTIKLAILYEMFKQADEGRFLVGIRTPLGSSIEYSVLQPETRQAWLRAASVMIEPFAE